MRKDNKSISCLSEIQQLNEEANYAYDAINDTGINECFQMMQKLDQLPEEKPALPVKPVEEPKTKPAVDS